MYNVIIVEDDAIVRMYLRTLIDWPKFDMNLVAEKENGKEAKDFIENNPVDIVITDVTMPVMNGIELIKYIKERDKQIKVIVLSCYTDYEFIREALKCGVCDYIIKQQVTKESLTSLLENIICSLKEEREASKNYNMAKANLVKNITNKVITNQDEAVEYLPQSSSLFKKSKYLVVVLKIDDYIRLQDKLEKSQLNNYYGSVIKIVENSLEGKISGIVEKTQDNEFTFLSGFERDEENDIIIEKLRGIISDINTNVKQNLPFTLSVTVSNICSDFSEIPAAYKLTQSMIESQMLFNKSKIFFMKNRNVNYNSILTLEDEKNLLENVIEGDAARTRDLIGKFVSKFEASLLQGNNLKICIVDLLNTVIRVAIKCEIDISKLFETGHIPYEEIQSKQDIEEIKTWFIAIINKIISLNSEKDNSHRIDILKAIEYIEKNYLDEISLRDISDLVNISPNYLSMIFKKEMGVSFSEYLLNLRLEKSKMLLKKSNIKIYEAASRAGFNNDQYFNRVFKKKYGITPLEYKKESK